MTEHTQDTFLQTHGMFMSLFVPFDKRNAKNYKINRHGLSLLRYASAFLYQ